MASNIKDEKYLNRFFCFDICNIPNNQSACHFTLFFISRKPGETSRACESIFVILFSSIYTCKMLRLPSQPTTTEWNTSWKEIQPALRKVRRSMASLRTSSLKVMRVSQLDSDILDIELGDILKEQLWSALSLFKVKKIQ